MAKRGPKPKPLALKLLHGTRADRLPTGRAPEAGRPEKPDFLDGVASGEWDRLVPLLAEMGVLCPAYGPALMLLCVNYSIWRQATDLVRTHGLTTMTQKGGTKLHPAVVIADRAGARLLSLLQEFGLTPSSRDRVTVARAPAEDDGIEAWLNRRRPDPAGENSD